MVRAACSRSRSSTARLRNSPAAINSPKATPRPPTPVAVASRASRSARARPSVSTRASSARISSTRPRISSITCWPTSVDTMRAAAWKPKRSRAVIVS